MARRKATPARREAMGGLAKGLAVIRAFTREHAALSLSDIARSAGIPANATNPRLPKFGQMRPQMPSIVWDLPSDTKPSSVATDS